MALGDGAYVPSGHAPHSRSDVWVLRTVTCCPALHVVRFVHARSLVGVGAVDWNCASKLQRVSCAHTRFDVALGPRASYSVWLLAAATS